MDRALGRLEISCLRVADGSAKERDFRALERAGIDPQEWLWWSNQFGGALSVLSVKLLLRHDHSILQRLGLRDVVLDHVHQVCSAGKHRPDMLQRWLQTISPRLKQPLTRHGKSQSSRN